MFIESVIFFFIAFFFLIMSDQCALNESGGLKEAEDIDFFFSKSEATPLHTSTALLKQNPGNTGESYIPLSLLL